MASKPSFYPAALVITIAVFLLVTFWRGSNGDGSSGLEQYTHAHAKPSVKTVTVTAAAAASQPTPLRPAAGAAAGEQVPKAAAAPAAVAVADDSSKPRYIFVDLGANGADSLETFLRHPGAKFEYDFPAPAWAKHEEAEIFLFEANPIFNDALVAAKQKYSALGQRVTIFPSTVVDTTDGLRTFYLDSVNAGNDYWGSSTYRNHPDAVASGAQGTELTAVNIARWLLVNALPRDFVVVKMDIEGAEYDILPHMADMRVWTVVDHLLVEWHGTLPTDEARQKAVAAVEKLKQEGVNCPHYDSSA